MMRDDIATCPSCGQGLDASGRRFYCGRCSGALVTEDELRELIADMAAGSADGPPGPRPLALEPPPGADGPPRRCPRCPARMTKHLFYGMVVDRCEAHGIWFDDQELQGALERVGAEAAKLPLRDRIAMTAVGVAVFGYWIASTIVRMGGR
jgi:Zn-finger nucleic acid-binding protein